VDGFIVKKYAVRALAVLTESLTKLMEPLLILFLGGMVGFIVVALFIPLVKLIEGLSK